MSRVACFNGNQLLLWLLAPCNIRPWKKNRNKRTVRNVVNEISTKSWADASFQRYLQFTLSQHRGLGAAGKAQRIVLVMLGAAGKTQRIVLVILVCWKNLVLLVGA